MKNREELEQPAEIQSRIYTSATDRALTAEIKRGADPYKLARYFDVDIRTVLRLVRRQKTINAIFKKREDQRLANELLRSTDGDNT